MREGIVRLEDVECLNCGERLDEDGAVELMQDPYNGKIWECPSCKRENSLSVYVGATLLDKEEA